MRLSRINNRLPFRQATNSIVALATLLLAHPFIGPCVAAPSAGPKEVTTQTEPISVSTPTPVDQRRFLPRPLEYRITEELPLGTVVVEDLIGDAGLGVSSSGSLTIVSTTVTTTPHSQQHLQQRSIRDDEFNVGSKRLSTPVRLVLLGERHQGQGQTKNFGLDDTGRRLVTTTDRLDRDSECPGLLRCTVEVDMMAMHPSNEVQKVLVIIELLDINDNVPRFPSSNLQLSIPESPSSSSAATGASGQSGDRRTLRLPIAVDLDSPVNGLAGFVLQPETAADNFRLIWNKAEEQLLLEIVRPVDREMCDRYNLQVVAFDSGSPRLSSTMSIHIRVLDVNDNPPSFDRSLYHVTVPEDAAVGRTLIRLSASDPDLGGNGEVRFRIQQRFGPISGQLGGFAGNVAPLSPLRHEPFWIDPITGDVTLNGSLDREAKANYRLTIIATDSPSDPSLTLTSMTTLTVTVTDVNDNAPYITVDSAAWIDTDDGDVIAGSSKDKTITVPVPSTFLRKERLTNMTGDLTLSVAQVSVTDADTNQQIDCRLDQRENSTASQTFAPVSTSQPPTLFASFRLIATESSSGIARYQLMASLTAAMGVVLPARQDLLVTCSDGNMTSFGDVNVVFVMIEVLAEPGAATDRRSMTSSVNHHVTLSPSVDVTDPCATSLNVGDNTSSVSAANVDPPDEGSGGLIISGQVIFMASIAAGCAALVAGVALAVLCLTVPHGAVLGKHRGRCDPSKGRRRRMHTADAAAAAWSKISLENTSMSPYGDVIEANKCTTCRDEDEATLCRNSESAVRLGDDFVLTLMESEPLNYTLRHQRWLQSLTDNSTIEPLTSHDMDSGVTDMTNSILSTGYGAANESLAVESSRFPGGAGSSPTSPSASLNVRGSFPTFNSQYSKMTYPPRPIESTSPDVVSPTSAVSNCPLLPPPDNFKRDDVVVDSATWSGYQTGCDVGWYSKTDWNERPIADVASNDDYDYYNVKYEMLNRSQSTYQRPSMTSSTSSFQLSHQHQRRQSWRHRSADDMLAECSGGSGTETSNQKRLPGAVRTGSMVQSSTTGSRKSVRFADETDLD